MSATRYRAAEERLFAAAGIEPVERWITLPTLGVRTRVLEVGDGAPVVFLHGGPMAAATWSHVAGAMDGLRCLLVDRPGTGLSEPPPTVPTPATLRTYVESISVDVLDALHIDRAAFVGSSFGGYSALCTGATHPDRVSRLVLAGFPAFVPGWEQPAFFRLLRTPVLWRLLLRAPVTRASARMGLRQLGHGRSLADGRIDDAMLEWTVAWQRHTATMRNDALMIRACGTRRHGFAASLDLDDGDLADVAAPCLVLAGTDDPVGDGQRARELARRLPDATVDVWEHAGHLPWLDDPRRAAAAISDFTLHAGTPA